MFATSCSKKYLVSTGAHDNIPLLYNGEYKTENLKEVNVDGNAFWGIPSFRKNNQNNHKRGFLFTFNGVEVGKAKRIFPILTMIGYSFGSATLIQTIAGKKTRTENFGGFSYEYEDGNKISFIPALLLGLPLAGTLNNFTWNSAALSGASETMSYRLVEENPNTDVFFYPKYEVNKMNVFSEGKVNLRYLWFQDANLKAKVSGATLIRSK